MVDHIPLHLQLEVSSATSATFSFALLVSSEVPITPPAEQIYVIKAPYQPAFLLPKHIYSQIFPLALHCRVAHCCCWCGGRCSHLMSPPFTAAAKSRAEGKVFCMAKSCVPAHRRCFSPPKSCFWGFGSFHPGILPQGLTDENTSVEQCSLSTSSGPTGPVQLLVASAELLGGWCGYPDVPEGTVGYVLYLIQTICLKISGL